ncbi:hypothetical protein M405DRAFT_930568 [Rhizopogon salebrosus TDB-379]|nr:hypothetical protein M405DRAFT_930568 [Rhizopogon salebrosus TDB-379]
MVYSRFIVQCSPQHDHPPPFVYLSGVRPSHLTLNPYLSVMLIFLATIMKRAEALSVLERSIPWRDLTQFFAIIPHDIFSAQELNIPAGGSGRWAMLTSDCAPLLPEDWCLRGMGSVAKSD